ncbi:MAG: lysylphosphatidylglycerol synthase domain-containing protein [Opitutaceae bacterium]
MAMQAIGWVRRYRRLISIVVGLISAVLASVVLARQDWAAIFDIVRQTAAGHVISASLLVALSFLALSGYDIIAIRLAGMRLPPIGLILKTSFVGTVMAMNFGFTALSGGAVRAFYYGRAGIPPKGIALILAHMAATFLLGWLGLFGAALLFWPIPRLSEDLGLSEAVQRAGGVILLCALAGYIIAAFFRLRLRLGQFVWQLPSVRLVLVQIAVSLADACLAGLVVHHLLPPPAPAFLPFMGAFLTAVLMGMVSQVPGGLGVIEVTLMQLLESPHPPANIVASMLLYRLLNFLAPLFLAGVIVLFDLTRWKQRPA